MIKKISELQGKTVSFGTGNDTLAIKDCQFMELEGKLFVVGKVPQSATQNDWALGQECAISWETVTDFIIFETEEKYVDLIQKSEH